MAFMEKKGGTIYMKTEKNTEKEMTESKMESQGRHK